MRRKLGTIAAVGALTLGGAAIAGTAIAATDDSTPTPSSSAPSPSSSAPTPGDDAAARAARDARTEKIKQALAGLVADKTLTQEQADKVASTLAASGGLKGPGRNGGRDGFGPRAGLAAAAKALGVSEADLATALRSGKSLAAVAEEKGVAVDKVVAALVEEAKARLAQAVKDGKLTQAQADERLKDLQARITERVNATGRTGPGGFGRGHGGWGGPPAGTPAPGDA